MSSSTMVSLGSEVIAILQDGSWWAIGSIASELVKDRPFSEVQHHLDRWVVDGVVRRHYSGGVWFYQLEVANGAA